MHANATSPGDAVQAVVQSTKLAISSLALLMCQPEEVDLDAAATSLEATHQALEPVYTYLNRTWAAPEVLTSAFVLRSTHWWLSLSI
jgi:hypothetical protein